MTLALTVPVPEALAELLIAELADLGFDAFETTDDAVVAYAPAARLDDVARQHVEDWLRARGVTPRLSERVEPAQDWNARWEATIEPLAVGDFLIRPTWHAAPPAHADKTELVVDPKMSFGTGYHPSTRLVLRFLGGLVEPGARVLDVGTGTGILAIAALKRGAAEAVGVDVDPWSVENAAENAALNGVADRLTIREGGIEVAPPGPYDLGLANINRNVLLSLLPALAEHVPSGPIVLAGLLQTDRATVLEALSAHGLSLQDEATEAEWWSCVVQNA